MERRDAEQRRAIQERAATGRSCAGQEPLPDSGGRDGALLGGRATAAEGAGGDATPVGASAAASAAAALRGPINRSICSRVSGPARYDMHQRVSNSAGALLVHVVQQEDALAEPGDASSPSPRDRTPPPPADRAFQPVEHARSSRSVCSRPMNQVPALDSPL